ncbi:lytic transglycosylase domain-containing protein [Paenibacillaceae bacterium]|nr:lytic transglycosylase domain-containing protein [Paenibacillaceae bacterium]
MRRRLRKKRIFLLLLVIVLIVLFVNSSWIAKWMYPIHYRDDIRVSATNYGVDPYLVAAVIRSETNYKTGKESSKGALGIMQIMPDTAGWIAEQAKFTNISLDDVHHRADIGIEMGTWYLRSLIRQFDNNEIAAIAAYNAGPGNVRNWLRKGVWDGEAATTSQIPFGETRHYLQRVLYYHNKYKTLYEEF